MPITRRFALVTWILTASILAGAAAPPGASAQDAPPSGAAFSAPEGPALTKIQKRFANGRPARITGPAGVQVVNSPLITPIGVEWSADSTAGQDSLAAATIVRWSELQRLQIMGNAAGTGARSGAVVFGLLSLVIGISVQSDPFVGGSGAGVLAATAGGALFGAGIGALIGLGVPKWVNVHVGTTAR